jgi:hypothetical protein
MEYRLKFYCILPGLEPVHPRVAGVYDVVTHPSIASTGGDRSRGARYQAEVTHFS